MKNIIDLICNKNFLKSTTILLNQGKFMNRIKNLEKVGTEHNRII
jgi:hypothetical protein